MSNYHRSNVITIDRVVSVIVDFRGDYTEAGEAK